MYLLIHYRYTKIQIQIQIQMQIHRRISIDRNKNKISLVILPKHNYHTHKHYYSMFKTQISVFLLPESTTTNPAPPMTGMASCLTPVLNDRKVG